MHQQYKESFCISLRRVIIPPVLLIKAHKCYQVSKKKSGILLERFTAYMDKFAGDNRVDCDLMDEPVITQTVFVTFLKKK